MMLGFDVTKSGDARVGLIGMLPLLTYLSLVLTLLRLPICWKVNTIAKADWNLL